MVAEHIPSNEPVKPSEGTTSPRRGKPTDPSLARLSESSQPGLGDRGTPGLEKAFITPQPDWEGLGKLRERLFRDRPDDFVITPDLTGGKEKRALAEVKSNPEVGGEEASQPITEGDTPNMKEMRATVITGMSSYAAMKELFASFEAPEEFGGVRREGRTPRLADTPLATHVERSFTSEQQIAIGEVLGALNKFADGRTGRRRQCLQARHLQPD